MNPKQGVIVKDTKVIGVRVRVADADEFTEKCRSNNTSIPKVIKKFIKEYKGK